MYDIPIFDSLTHPMPDGGWLGNRFSGLNTIETVLASMREHQIQWGFAVGMGPDTGGYTEHCYASFIRNRTKQLLPIAFVDFEQFAQGVTVECYLRNLLAYGYSGIKIHPRLHRIGLTNPYLPDLIRVANRLGLVVLLCTYFWSRDQSVCDNSPEKLLSLLRQVPDEKLILLHGGAVRLLEVAEIARQFPRTLLDLSFTLCKYEGSSIDLDIRYLFQQFDQRICIGSDSPEFSHAVLRSRFAFFSDGLIREKKENIAFRNIQNYMEFTS